MRHGYRSWLGLAVALVWGSACQTDGTPPGRLVGDACPSFVEREDAVVTLLDFEDPVDLGDQIEPRKTFSAHSSVRVASDASTRFLRVEYDAAPPVPGSEGFAAQSSYSVVLPYEPVGAGSVLVFWYRSSGVTGAVINLHLLDQVLLARIHPDDTTEWRRVCLSLDSRFTEVPNESRTASLQLTSYAKPPRKGRPSYIEIDEIQLARKPDLLGLGKRSLAKRVEERNRAEARIDAALQLRSVRSSRARYLPGDHPIVSFEVWNGSGASLRVPRDRSGADKYPLVITQLWIEPLDAAARRTDFGRARHDGTRFAAGGTTRYAPGPELPPDRRMTFSRSFAYLESGRYRVIVELRSVDDGELLAEASTEFEIATAK